jgi:hypothetical protein
VIHPGSEDQPTYWALSGFTALDEARGNLRDRESAKLEDIHYLARNGEAATGIPQEVGERMRDWLAIHGDLEVVTWTGLRSNWRDKRRRDFTPADAVSYLKELEAAGDQAIATYDRAREYIRNAPPDIQTPVRRAMRAQGWQDDELPEVLFES